MNVEQINFHHLRYFWAVANDGNLTRTAARLRVAQSALSSQIRSLEEQLDEPLFLREGRRLELTEAGRIVLTFANEIFSAGSQLVHTLEHGRQRSQVLRIGAVATLSRNFQESFIGPLLDHDEVELRLESGRLDDLIGRLEEHSLDLVLANRLPEPHRRAGLHCRRVAKQPVSIIGAPQSDPFRFPESLEQSRVILPGRESDIRAEFDALCQQRGITLQILAEVDDMATMRLLARDTLAPALLPSVVVRDEIRSGKLQELYVVPGLFESFFAITADRRFQHPLLKQALAQSENDLLATTPNEHRGEST